MTHGDKDSHARNMARAAELDRRKTMIQQLNDAFRCGMGGGRWVVTRGVQSLGVMPLNAIVQQVRAFDSFSADNDPHAEHDFGSFEWEGQTVFWKIDCYDKTMEFGSPDASNPDLTMRVITIMLASEY